MAVSYLSTPVQSSPMIAPVDLNLMAKVLSVKQGQFDAEGEKIQSQITTIANTDILRGVDRDYLNKKLNSIVNNVNNLGGVDLADVNISNQIGNYASSIYNDDKVISAISSTRKARSLMSSYDKMKTDPKLIKYYSEANEYNDKKSLNQWMADPNAGSSYAGPSTATRYEDYNKDFADIFKNIIPKKYTKLTTGNGYIENDSGEVLSEKDVYEMAQGMLNPIQREQMSRDATFLYEAKARYGKEQLVGKVLQHRDEELYNEKSILSQLRAAMVEANPLEKSKIMSQIDKKQSYIKSLESSKSQEAAYYSQLYDVNPQELMYRTYSNDYFRSIGKRYAVDRVNKTLVGDPVMLEQFRQKNQTARTVMGINAASRLQAQRDASALQRTGLEIGARLEAARISAGAKSGAPLTPEEALAAGNIMPNISTKDMDARTKIAEDKMYEAKVAMKSIKDDYVNTVIAEHPEMTTEDANASFQMLSEAMAQKSVMKEGLIKNLPVGFGDKFEQYNILEHQHKTLEKAAMLGQFNRPQYLTKVITPDDQNNNKDTNYRTYEAIKVKLKNQGLINDTKDVTLKEVYAAPEEDGGGFKITYVEGSGAKQGKVKSIDLTPETAKALGFVEPPGGLGILNRTVDKGNDFVTYVQNSQDPNFVGKVRVYKVKDGEFGAQYIYSNGVPINLLKMGNVGSPAEAYKNASDYIKKYRSGNAKNGKYQTKLDFEKDLGIPEEQQIAPEKRSNHAPTWTAEDLQRYKPGNFQRYR